MKQDIDILESVDEHHNLDTQIKKKDIQTTLKSINSVIANIILLIVDTARDREILIKLNAYSPSIPLYGMDLVEDGIAFQNNLEKDTDKLENGGILSIFDQNLIEALLESSSLSLMNYLSILGSNKITPSKYQQIHYTLLNYLPKMNR